MRNLKRVLTLVMAVAMMMSLLVVGAGAAFNDQDKIENTEAVNMNVALGIIKGRDTGAFDPTGNVTRAEMAKMIAVALNGGKDPSLGTLMNPTYKDIKGHWAEAYIEYCTSLGIVAGMGNGNFNPNANVTGTQAAKMLLVALGYDAAKENFNGANWSVNINVRASQKDLYDDLTIDPNAALNRDDAAQMIYNGINAVKVEYDFKLTTVGGVLTTVAVIKDVTVTKDTLAKEKFGLVTVKLAFNGDYNTGAAAKKDQIDVGGTDITYTMPNGLALIGEEVKVLYKDDGNTSNVLDFKDTVYGVYSTGDTTVYNTTKDALQAVTATDKIKFNDTEYSLGAVALGTQVINYNYGKTTVNASGNTAATLKTDLYTNLDVANNGDTIKFVCNDDGKIVKAFVIESSLRYITAANSSKVSVSGIGALDVADHNFYNGIAKNDIVVVTDLYPTANRVVTVVPAEKVEGKLTGYNGTTKATIDGTTYKIVGLAATLGEDTGTTTFTTSELNDEFTMYMVNGMIAGAVQAADANVDYAVVADVGTGKLGSSMDPAKVKLILADGTSAVVTLHKDSIIKIDASAYANGGAAIANNGTVALNSTATGNLQAGQLVKYSVLSDGTYKITEVGTYTIGGSVTNLYNKDTKTFDSFVTAGTCPLFTLEGSDYKVYNIRSLGNVSTTAQTHGYFTDDGKVVAAYAVQSTRPSGSSSSMYYGIVSTFNGVVEVDSDYYNKYTVENDKGTSIVLLPTANTLTVGALVGFDKASDDIYSAADVTSYTGTTYNATNGLATWVKSYSETDKILTYYANVGGTAGAYVGANPTTVALDDDCAIVYVNTDDDEAGSNIGISAFDAITGYKNVMLVKDASNSKVVAIFVESSGDDSAIAANTAVAPTTLTLAAGVATFPTIADGTLLDNGSVTGFNATTAKTVAITVAGAADSYTFTVNGTTRASGAEFDLTATGTYTVVVTAVTSGCINGTYTYTFTVA